MSIRIDSTTLREIERQIESAATTGSTKELSVALARLPRNFYDIEANSGNMLMVTLIQAQKTAEENGHKAVARRIDQITNPSFFRHLCNFCCGCC